MKPEPFAPWQCPLCGEPLTGDTALKCGRNHSFDRAKEGYWHLLPVQSMRTKAPGDSKEMVAARRAFLTPGITASSAGHWGNCALHTALPPGRCTAPPAGCGLRRSWYDRCIAQAFAQAGRPVQLAGFDIASCGASGRKALPAANTRWHPALPSLSAPNGPTCCSTVSRPLHRKSSGVCCARADG